MIDDGQKVGICMEQKKQKLIIIDGMPGSGKTTYATEISNYLDNRKIKHRCVLQLEQEHPLLLHNESIEDLSDGIHAEYFIENIKKLYCNFVEERLKSSDEITIIESVLFQDTINMAYHLGMNERKLNHLCDQLFEILSPLEPSMIYFYQVDIEGQWRYICNIRGNVWGQVSLFTDEQFQEAGRVWSGSQKFVREYIDQLVLPKLIIENADYHWDEYSLRIIHFIKTLLDDHVDVFNPLKFLEYEQAVIKNQ